MKSQILQQAESVTTSALDNSLSNQVLNHSISVSYGRNYSDNTPTEAQRSIQKLVDEFSTPDTHRGTLPLLEYLALDKNDPGQKKLRNREKDGDYIILGTFSVPGTRSAEYMKQMHGFMIDLDQGKYEKPQIEEIMKGTFCIAFTTYSHHPQDPRWRIVVPYAGPISPEDHHKIFVHFNKLFGGNLDPRCDTTNQIWYTPACPPDAAENYEVFATQGNLLDTSTIPEVARSASKKPFLPPSPNITTLEVERVRSALASTPSDDRGIWVNTGIALKQNMPAKVAYDLWMEWSQKSKKFDPEDAEKTWDSFKDHPEGDAITLGSVFYHAKENGWSDTQPSMPAAVEKFNTTHFIAFHGGKNFVFEEKFNPELKRWGLQPYPFKDFREHYSNMKVTIPAGDSFKTVCVADYWLQHPARRTYKSIVFMPDAQTPPDVYNTWRGFAVTPSPGNWDLLKQHMLDNICQGDGISYEYLLKWMAFAVQNPGKRPGVAVVMQGAQGTGKGKLASLFMKLFSNHAWQITQSSHLVGKFNYHLRDCVLLFVDEALWAGDKAGENVLKGLITEQYLQIEKKFSDLEAVPNCLHIMMASNNDWVVPAGAHERRYFVLKVGEAQMQNNAYFKAIEDQMLTHGGLEAMMDELIHIDLSNFNISAFPRTAALDEQKLRTMSSEDTWWMDHLGNGDPVTWKHQVRSTLASTFAESYGTSRNRQSETRLGMYLNKVVPGGVKKVTAVPAFHQGPVACYEFPDLQVCKDAFIKKHGLVSDPWA